MSNTIPAAFEVLTSDNLDDVNGGIDWGKVNAQGQNWGTTGALVGGGAGSVVGGIGGAVGGTAVFPGPGTAAGAMTGAATVGGLGAAAGGGVGYAAGAATEAYRQAAPKWAGGR